MSHLNNLIKATSFFTWLSTNCWLTIWRGTVETKKREKKEKKWKNRSGEKFENQLQFVFRLSWVNISNNKNNIDISSSNKSCYFSFVLLFLLVRKRFYFEGAKTEVFFGEKIEPSRNKSTDLVRFSKKTFLSDQEWIVNFGFLLKSTSSRIRSNISRG